MLLLLLLLRLATSQLVLFRMKRLKGMKQKRNQMKEEGKEKGEKRRTIVFALQTIQQYHNKDMRNIQPTNIVVSWNLTRITFYCIVLSVLSP